MEIQQKLSEIYDVFLKLQQENEELKAKVDRQRRQSKLDQECIKKLKALAERRGGQAYNYNRKFKYLREELNKKMEDKK